MKEASVLIEFVKAAMEANGHEWDTGRAIGANIFIDPGRGDLYVQIGFDNDTRLMISSDGSVSTQLPNYENQSGKGDWTQVIPADK